MADKFIPVDAAAVLAQIAALLSLHPELGDDETLRSDMLEGATGLHEIAARIVDRKLELDSRAAAVKERATALKERQARYEAGSDAMRDLLRSLMAGANVSRLELTEATISVQPGRASVNVLDVDELPQGFYRVKKEADKVAIAKSFGAGEDVPGAAMVMGDPIVTVRTK